MRLHMVLASAALLLSLSACQSMMKANPDFVQCANTCSNKQSSCMLDASSGQEIEQCKTSQTTCVTHCESKFPRYIKRQ